jgi:hypothetical protein
MQQETPQVNQPAPQMPPTSGPPNPQEERRADFYQPAVPLVFAGTDHALPAPNRAPQQAPEGLSWEASEYVHIDKGGAWIAGLVIVTLVFVGIAVWLAAWTFVALILVMAVAVGVFAFRPPHTVRYTLTHDGIIIGDKTFNYSDFRAFGILEDGAFFTMTLIPIKRFAPALSVYFAEDHGEQIVDIVGDHLPMEDVKPDFIDTIVRRLRF